MVSSDEYMNLVAKLKKRVSIKTQDGLDIIIKSIPDSDVKGDLDSRVLKVMNELREKFSKAEPKAPASIEDMRSMMGFPNIDITSTEIEVKSKNVQGRDGVIPVKIYSPKKSSGKRLMPAIIFIHGGGFFGGSLKTVENPCKYLAEKANAVVVSVDYRLAPEHKFPAGFNDCFDVVKWVYENGSEINVDSSKIGVSGDSAGGNLSAVCSIMDRDMGTNMIKFQALIYPVVNISSISTEDYKWDISEYEINNNKEMITAMVNSLNDPSNFVTKLYLQNESDEMNKYVSPFFADTLKNLPETLIITAEYDFLRIQCEAFARRLKSAGVKVNIIRYNGMDHAFIDKIGVYPQAADCMDEIAERFIQ